MNHAAVLLSAIYVAGFAVAGEPEKILRDTTPPSLSLYLPLKLAIPKVPSQTTGVFLPENYRAGKTVDLLVFLRGYDIKRPTMATSVGEYWNSPKHPVLQAFQFREEVNRSGKNVVLAVPPLGPFAEFGTLKDADGARAFLDAILDGLWRFGPHASLQERPALRHLILAAHSGGGVALRRLAQIYGDDNTVRGKLKECWGFDSIYGVKDRDAAFWSTWAKDHPASKITMYYIPTYKEVGKDPKVPVSQTNPLDYRQPTGTTAPAMELDRLAQASKLPNVVVVRETKDSTLSHNEVPRAHLANNLKAAVYLDAR